MATTNLMRLISFLFLAHFATAIPFLGHNELGVAVSSDSEHLPVNAVLSPRKTVSRRGYIRALSASDKGYIGHLSSNSETGFFGLTTSNASAIVIQYDASSQAPYNLNVTNGQGSLASFPNLGLTFGSNPSPTLGTGSSNFCLLTVMDPTPKGSPPIMVRDSSPRSFPGESAIFTVDGSDNIVLKWINPDGSSPATHLIYSLEQNRLTATGDVAAYKEAFGQDRIEVVYQFVEIH